jgi:hypothetical protein
MRRIVALIFLTAFVGLGFAATPMTVPRDVDPDGEMHGVRFGATEAQVRAKLGAPTGTLQISDTRNALFYGKSHAFVFRKGRLVELHITEHLLDWELTQQMEEHPLFNAGRWMLKPGITDGMTFGEVMRQLKNENVRPGHRFQYETETASVELAFSGRVDVGEGEDKYHLMRVRLKSLNSAW